VLEIFAVRLTPESLSDNGYGRPVKMRAEFEQAGVMAKYDRAAHSERMYQTLEAGQQ